MRIKVDRAARNRIARAGDVQLGATGQRHGCISERRLGLDCVVEVQRLSAGHRSQYANQQASQDHPDIGSRGQDSQKTRHIGFWLEGGKLENLTCPWQNYSTSTLKNPLGDPCNAAGKLKL